MTGGARRKLPPGQGTIESLHSRTGINLLETFIQCLETVTSSVDPGRTRARRINRGKGKRPATEATTAAPAGTEALHAHGGEGDRAGYSCLLAVVL
jgi:hypothetical protein